MRFFQSRARRQCGIFGTGLIASGKADRTTFHKASYLGPHHILQPPKLPLLTWKDDEQVAADDTGGPRDWHVLILCNDDHLDLTRRYDRVWL